MSLLGRPGALRAQRLADLGLVPEQPVLLPRLEAAPEPTPEPPGRLSHGLRALAWPLGIYVATRAVLFVIAGASAAVQHKSLSSVLSLYDGGWYLRLAAHGYPTQALHAKSTLGFFPLYPLVMRALAFLTSSSLLVGGIIAALLGGAVATVLVERLATAWWGEGIGRRAALFFVLFPGSVVFSLAYSECLTIPLALGCLLALRAKRWWLAGLLAGLATAVAPVAVVLVLSCAVAAWRELREAGSEAGRRPLVAVPLSMLGIGGFAIFLWAWTGTPFATLTAQHYGWHAQGDLLGILGLPMVHHLASHPHDILNYLPTWNLWSGIFGAVFFLLSAIGLVRSRHELSPGALTFALGIGIVTILSVMTPPNARMLLIATPAVLIWARRTSSRRLMTLFGVEGALFVFMSVLTLSGHMLP